MPLRHRAGVARWHTTAGRLAVCGFRGCGLAHICKLHADARGTFLTLDWCWRLSLRSACCVLYDVSSSTESEREREEKTARPRARVCAAPARAAPARRARGRGGGARRAGSEARARGPRAARAARGGGVSCHTLSSAVGSRAPRDLSLSLESHSHMWTDRYRWTCANKHTLTLYTHDADSHTYLTHTHVKPQTRYRNS